MFLLLWSCSDSLGGSLSVPLPLSSSEPAYHSSSVPLPNLTPSSIGTAGTTNPPSSSSAVSSNSSSVPSSSHFSTVGGSYNGTISSHSRLSFSQGKESTGPVMVRRCYQPAQLNDTKSFFFSSPTCVSH